MMHLATIYYAARRWRLGAATLVLSSALTVGHPLQPMIAHAQSISPGRVPAERGYTAPALVEDENAPAAASTELIHEIAVGDTLSNVAQRYNVTLENLAAYNQILDNNHIVIGQKLRIPPAGLTITAPAADTLALPADVTVPTADVAVPALPGADGYHVVRIGESLGAIAQRYQLTLEELMALNEIDDLNLVVMGTMLRVTDKVEPVSTVTLPEKNVFTYTVQAGESLEEIAQLHYTTAAAIAQDNDLTTETLRVGQQLRIYPPATALEAFGVDAPVDGERKIVIDLSDQTLTAYQGDVRVLHTLVSTGKADTPTIPGEFTTYLKYKSQRMTGDDYDLPGVPWVMYYYEGYAIHGAYWHANFGTPTSHGCTNMTIPDSKALYSWAPLGTRVIVQE